MDSERLAHDPAGRIIEDAPTSTRDTDRTPGSEVIDPKAAERQFEDSLKGLEAQSRELKDKITDEKRRHDMPVNSSLGDPAVDARNADGRNDLEDSDED
jgi:hypothetical protein